MQWIHVRDKLPKKRGRYLVASWRAGAVRYRIDIADFNPKNHPVWNRPKIPFAEVSYWMPLPEGPNE